MSEIIEPSANDVLASRLSAAHGEPTDSGDDTWVNEGSNEGQCCAIPETSCNTHCDRRCLKLTPITTGEVMVTANRSCGASPEAAHDLEDCLEEDWTGKEVCIKCNKRGKLLVCSGSNCPLVVRECMDCLAQFDSKRKFYCSYCSYKQAMLETRIARRKVTLAKKALSVFLDEGKMVGGLQKQKTERVGREPNPSAVVGHRFEVVQIGKDVQEEYPKVLDDHQNGRLVQGELDASVSAYHVERKKVDGALHMSTEGQLDSDDRMKENEVRRPKEEMRKQDKEINKQEQGTLISSGGGDSNGQQNAKVCDSSVGSGRDASPCCRHIEKKNNISVQPPKVDHPRQAAGKAFETNPMVVRKGKKDTTSKSRQQLTNPTIFHVRRKKLPWTSEEEEMLKEGVHKFSNMMNKNLPWRKILEFGQHVFDRTRTPVDLKDKWRNILFREGSKE